MNRRNGNWLAPSINQLTATAVTDLAALSGYRSIKPAVFIQPGELRPQFLPEMIDRNQLSL
jgi:hypothetical protein